MLKQRKQYSPVLGREAVQLWEAVYLQTQRCLKAGVFEALVHDLRAVLRLAKGRMADPSVSILDSRTMRLRPESGGRTG